MNTFSQIGVNVGGRVGDTSAGFLVQINQYINQRYQRLFKKFNWPTIVPGYTFNTVVGTQDYVLPSDFKHALYVYDGTNFKDIPQVDFEELERMYPDTLTQQGNFWKCAIYDSLDNTTPSPLIKKTVRFFYTPSSIVTIQMPYVKQGVNLSATTDLPIIDMADLASELGATADAWRTKRQFAKAADFESQYEQIVQEMIWSIENDPNRVAQFRPNTFSPHNLY